MKEGSYWTWPKVMTPFMGHVGRTVNPGNNVRHTLDAWRLERNRRVVNFLSSNCGRASPAALGVVVSHCRTEGHAAVTSTRFGHA